MRTSLTSIETLLRLAAGSMDTGFITLNRILKQQWSYLQPIGTSAIAFAVVFDPMHCRTLCYIMQAAGISWHICIVCSIGFVARLDDVLGRCYLLGLDSCSAWFQWCGSWMRTRISDLDQCAPIIWHCLIAWQIIWTAHERDAGRFRAHRKQFSVGSILDDVKSSNQAGLTSLPKGQGAAKMNCCICTLGRLHRCLWLRQ